MCVHARDLCSEIVLYSAKVTGHFNLLYFPVNCHLLSGCFALHFFTDETLAQL